MYSMVLLAAMSTPGGDPPPLGYHAPERVVPVVPATRYAAPAAGCQGYAAGCSGYSSMTYSIYSGGYGCSGQSRGRPRIFSGERRMGRIFGRVFRRGQGCY